MADQHTRPNMAALRKLEASLEQDLRQREAVMRAPQARGAPHIHDSQIPRVARSRANGAAGNPIADNAIAGNVAAARRGEPVTTGAAPAMRTTPAHEKRASSRDPLGGSYYWRASVLNLWWRLRKVAYVAGGLAGDRKSVV